jgi:hypothetical protein
LGSGGDVLADTARAAFVDAWATAMWAGVVIAGLALAWVVFRGPTRDEHMLDEDLDDLLLDEPISV